MSRKKGDKPKMPVEAVIRGLVDLLVEFNLHRWANLTEQTLAPSVPSQPYVD